MPPLAVLEDRMQYDCVIIGNSAAGLSAIKTLRALDSHISIGLFDIENESAYSRVLTPYYAGYDIEKDKLYIVNYDFYKQNGVDTYLGKKVDSIDANKKTIEGDGFKFSYKNLMIGTGASAKHIGIQNERVRTLRHMSDAIALRAFFKEAQYVAALGAGLVSLPTLSHLREDVVKHIIVGSNRIFSQVVDKQASLILEEAFAKKNVKIYKQNDLLSINTIDSNTIELTLKSKDKIRCNVLLVGKGVEPNIDLGKNAGISTKRGIIIDEYCKSDANNIWAAGDVAEGLDFLSKIPTIQGNWITAIEQGIVAAKNMLGVITPYDGSIKNNTTEVFGIDVAVVGYNKDDAPKTIEFHDKDRVFYRKVFLDEQDTIIGATLITQTNDAGIYYNLIKTHTKINKFQSINGFANYAKFLRNLDYR